MPLGTDSDRSHVLLRTKHPRAIVYQAGLSLVRTRDVDWFTHQPVYDIGSKAYLSRALDKKVKG